MSVKMSEEGKINKEIAFCGYISILIHLITHFQTSTTTRKNNNVIYRAFMDNSMPNEKQA